MSPTYLEGGMIALSVICFLTAVYIGLRGQQNNPSPALTAARTKAEALELENDETPSHQAFRSSSTTRDAVTYRYLVPDDTVTAKKRAPSTLQTLLATVRMPRLSR